MRLLLGVASCLCILFGCASMMTEEKIEGKALAAIYESDTKTLDRLIKRGLSVNMKMYGNSSLLSCAVFSSNEVMVRYLLS